MKRWQKVLLGTAGVLGACAWLWWQDEPLAPQAQAWLEEAVRERWGREGIRRAGDLTLPPGLSPFTRLAQLRDTLA